MQSNENDRVAMTHFTSQEAAAQILDGWRHEMLKQTSASEEFGPKELSLRLYSRYGMNDPTEYLHDPRKAGGGIGSQREDGLSHSRLVFPDTAFIYCGSREIKNEALDRLDLWRAYGADGKGIAITTIWSKKGLADDGFENWCDCVQMLAVLRRSDLNDEVGYRRMVSEINQFVQYFLSNYTNPPSDLEEAKEVVKLVQDFVGRDGLIAANPAYRQGDWLDKVTEASAIHLRDSAVNSENWNQTLNSYEGQHAVPLMTIHKSKGL